MADSSCWLIFCPVRPCSPPPSLLVPHFQTSYQPHILLTQPTVFIVEETNHAHHRNIRSLSRFRACTLSFCKCRTKCYLDIKSRRRSHESSRCSNQIPQCRLWSPSPSYQCREVQERSWSRPAQAQEQSSVFWWLRFCSFAQTSAFIGSPLKARSSPTPCTVTTGVISVVQDSTNGYLTSTANSFGEYGFTTSLDSALRVSLCPTDDSPFVITPLVRLCLALGI